MQIKKLFITTLLIILTLFLPKTFAQEVLSVELIVPPRAHYNRVYSIAFSPDGKIIASRGSDKIQLWDTNTYELLTVLNGDGLFEGDIAFSPNGKIIAGGKNKKVRLWNAKTGKTLKTFDGHQKLIKTIAFSPDGKILASGSLDQTIRLWNIRKGKLLHILENDRIGQISPTEDMDFSPDGSILATAHLGNTAILFWDPNTGEFLQELETGFPATVFSFSFSADGDTLACGGWGGLQLWNAKTAELLHNIIELPEDIIGRLGFFVQNVALSHNKKIVACTQSGFIVELWDATTTAKEPIQILEGHEGKVTSVAFSPNGSTLASGDSNGEVRLWQVGTFLNVTPKGKVLDLWGNQKR
jgi:WD40 repeat protein